jgi:hypothetical protein
MLGGFFIVLPMRLHSHLGPKGPRAISAQSVGFGGRYPEKLTEFLDKKTRHFRSAVDGLNRRKLTAQESIEWIISPIQHRQ